MADNRNGDGTGTSITPAKSHSWSQLPGESAEAYAGFRAYAALPASERTIAAAYRKVKEVGPDTKVPGYFGRWSSLWNWRQRASDWDNHVQSLAEVADVAQLQAARRQTVEQAEELQAAIESELEEVKRLMDRDRRLGGHIEDQSGRLANLAQALEAAARARLMALGADTAEFPSHRQD